MDFRNMKRKELQSLCKKHGIPANLTNIDMIDKLSSILKEKDEKCVNQGRSCLKRVEEEGIACESDSDGVNRKQKKVRFSPVNETFEFVRSNLKSTENTRGTRSSVSSKVSLGDEIMENLSVKGRITRSRVKELVKTGGEIEIKKARKGSERNVDVSSKGKVVEDKKDDKVVLRRSRRSVKEGEEEESSMVKEVEEKVRSRRTKKAVTEEESSMVKEDEVVEVKGRSRRTKKAVAKVEVIVIEPEDEDDVQVIEPEKNEVNVQVVEPRISNKRTKKKNVEEEKVKNVPLRRSNRQKSEEIDAEPEKEENKIISKANARKSQRNKAIVDEKIAEPLKRSKRSDLKQESPRAEEKKDEDINIAKKRDRSENIEEDTMKQQRVREKAVALNNPFSRAKKEESFLLKGSSSKCFYFKEPPQQPEVVMDNFGESSSENKLNLSNDEALMESSNETSFDENETILPLHLSATKNDEISINYHSDTTGADHQNKNEAMKDLLEDVNEVSFEKDEEIADKDEPVLVDDFELGFEKDEEAVNQNENEAIEDIEDDNEAIKDHEDDNEAIKDLEDDNEAMEDLLEDGKKVSFGKDEEIADQYEPVINKELGDSIEHGFEKDEEADDQNETMDITIKGLEDFNEGCSGNNEEIADQYEPVMNSPVKELGDDDIEHGFEKDEEADKDETMDITIKGLEDVNEGCSGNNEEIADQDEPVMNSPVKELGDFIERGFEKDEEADDQNETMDITIKGLEDVNEGCSGKDEEIADQDEPVMNSPIEKDEEVNHQDEIEIMDSTIKGLEDINEVGFEKEEEADHQDINEIMDRTNKGLEDINEVGFEKDEEANLDENEIMDSTIKGLEDVNEVGFEKDEEADHQDINEIMYRTIKDLEDVNEVEFEKDEEIMNSTIKGLEDVNEVGFEKDEEANQDENEIMDSTIKGLEDVNKVGFEKEEKANQDENEIMDSSIKDFEDVNEVGFEKDEEADYQNENEIMNSTIKGLEVVNEVSLGKDEEIAVQDVTERVESVFDSHIKGISEDIECGFDHQNIYETIKDVEDVNEVGFGKNEEIADEVVTERGESVFNSPNKDLGDDIDGDETMNSSTKDLEDVNEVSLGKDDEIADQDEPVFDSPVKELGDDFEVGFEKDEETDHQNENETMVSSVKEVGSGNNEEIADQDEPVFDNRIKEHGDDIELVFEKDEQTDNQDENETMVSTIKDLEDVNEKGSKIDEESIQKLESDDHHGEVEERGVDTDFGFEINAETYDGQDENETMELEDEAMISSIKELEDDYEMGSKNDENDFESGFERDEKNEEEGERKDNIIEEDEFEEEKEIGDKYEDAMELGDDNNKMGLEKDEQLNQGPSNYSEIEEFEEADNNEGLMDLSCHGKSGVIASSETEDAQLEEHIVQLTKSEDFETLLESKDEVEDSVEADMAILLSPDAPSAKTNLVLENQEIKTQGEENQLLGNLFATPIDVSNMTSSSYKTERIKENTIINTVDDDVQGEQLKNLFATPFSVFKTIKDHTSEKASNKNEASNNSRISSTAMSIVSEKGSLEWPENEASNNSRISSKGRHESSGIEWPEDDQLKALFATPMRKESINYFDSVFEGEKNEEEATDDYSGFLEATLIKDTNVLLMENSEAIGFTTTSVSVEEEEETKQGISVPLINEAIMVDEVAQWEDTFVESNEQEIINVHDTTLLSANVNEEVKEQTADSSNTMFDALDESEVAAAIKEYIDSEPNEQQGLMNENENNDALGELGKRLFNMHQNSAASKSSNNRSILIHGTPMKSGPDMKENAPATKAEQIGSLTSVRPAKRRALEDLSWK